MQQDKAVLFADVSGSTHLYEVLGDARAFATINACLGTLSELTLKHSGRVVKTIGDEIMTVFPDAVSAVNAASEMQLVISEQPAIDGVNLAIRIGFHFGPVLENNDDVFGATVNVASRMAEIANGQQIITTRATVAELPPIMRNSTRSFNALSIRGTADDIEVLEVIWQECDDMTMVTINKSVTELAEPTLQLHHQGMNYLINSKFPAIVIGRDKQANIVVEDKRASRIHAKIELRRDKFVFVDMSSNGSYINVKNETEIELRREEFVLRESGSISLGHTYLKDPTEIIEFFC
jgi:hypothetical protein